MRKPITREANTREPVMQERHLRTTLLLAGAAMLMACTPTVRIEAPDKPIEINMNVNIKHEILVKVEKEVEKLFDENKGLF